MTYYYVIGYVALMTNTKDVPGTSKSEQNLSKIV